MICNELLVTADVRNALIHDYDPPLVAADPVNKINNVLQQANGYSILSSR